MLLISGLILGPGGGTSESEGGDDDKVGDCLLEEEVEAGSWCACSDTDDDEFGRAKLLCTEFPDDPVDSDGVKLDCGRLPPLACTERTEEEDVPTLLSFLEDSSDIRETGDKRTRERVGVTESSSFYYIERGCS